MSSENLKQWLALFHTKGIGATAISKLYQNNISPQDVLDNPDLWRKCQLNPPTNLPDWKAVERDLQWQAVDKQRFILSLDNVHYPAALKNITAPPPILFVQGAVDILQGVQFAIVGSRYSSQSARETAQSFAQQLSDAGFHITSGLALGIDAAAHQGALIGKNKTLAVMGTGLDRVYPARHQRLAHSIVDDGGALVSEFPIGMGAHANHFPRRNRIISAMSVAVLVIEAALRSGSLITARIAAEQGKQVFAIPGSIYDLRVKGCHQLIREGATLVSAVEDILDDLGSLLQQHVSSYIVGEQSLILDTLSTQQKEILAVLEFAPISLDALVEKSGYSIEEVSSVLLLLELEGYIEAMPGAMYKKLKEC